MRFQLAASAAVALLILAGAPASRAEKSKDKSKKNDTGEVPTGINKQFEWENKVVGPKEGIDKNHLAEVQERGRREDAARKKEPPKKPGRAAGVDAPASATLPTMDIEKPAASPARKPRKVASTEPRQKDSLDNLLESEGVKPDNPTHGRTGNDGLGSVFASDDKPSGGKKASAAKKRRHGN
jgi:hypothetical protein